MPRTLAKQGDRVALSAAFLRSICMYDKRIADRRGTVLFVSQQSPLVMVEWDRGDRQHVNVHNLTVVRADGTLKESP